MVLMHLSKRLIAHSHNLLIAKVVACGFYLEALKLFSICSYYSLSVFIVINYTFV